MRRSNSDHHLHGAEEEMDLRAERKSASNLVGDFFGSLLSSKPSTEDMRKLNKSVSESEAHRQTGFLHLPSLPTPPFFLSRSEKKDIFGGTSSDYSASTTSNTSATPSPNSSSTVSTADPSPAGSRSGSPARSGKGPDVHFTRNLSALLQALERDSEATDAGDSGVQMDLDEVRAELAEEDRKPAAEARPQVEKLAAKKPATPRVRKAPAMAAGVLRRDSSLHSKRAAGPNRAARDKVRPSDLVAPKPAKNSESPAGVQQVPLNDESSSCASAPGSRKHSKQHEEEDIPGNLRTIKRAASEETRRRSSHLRFHGWKHLNRPDVGLNDLELVKDTIGVGQYGTIKLVAFRGSKDSKHSKGKAHAQEEQFALKVINRERFKSHRQESMVLNEKHVMGSIDHPFHLGLINTYKTPTKLYVLVEYMRGGDLFDIIERGMEACVKSKDRNMTPISQKARKFYVANILLALRHMHKLGIVHRDIKSANLLVGDNGYLKVCDYGLSRFLPLGDTTTTLVGTYQYLAPEQCRLDPYDHSVDLWAMAITLYEMSFGHTPFDVADNDGHSDYSKNIIHRILNRNIIFPSEPEIGLSAKLFIKSLLTKDKRRRLGGRLNYDEVMQSAWLQDVNWKKIEHQTFTAPYIPH